jgi:hypothetical protein
MTRMSSCVFEGIDIEKSLHDIEDNFHILYLCAYGLYTLGTIEEKEQGAILAVIEQGMESTRRVISSIRVRGNESDEGGKGCVEV